MYSGLLAIEEAKRRVNEAYRMAEVHKLAKQAKRAQTVPTINRGVFRLRFLVIALRRNQSRCVNQTSYCAMK